MAAVKIERTRCLILSDIHQDISWVKNVLKTEGPENFDKIIFNGDWFDTFRKDLPSVRETAAYMNELDEKYADKIIWICGNHDLPYYYAWAHFQKKYGKLKDQPYYCSGYTNSKAQDIAKILNFSIIQKQHLAIFVNGYLISHAGVLPNLFPYFGDKEDFDHQALNRLLEDSEEAWENFRWDHNSPFFFCGQARWGRHPFSGPLWCDWNDEFYDCLPYPQILGHTYTNEDYKKGRCYNLDKSQSRYGILESDGTVIIKEIPNEFSDIRI